MDLIEDLFSDTPPQEKREYDDKINFVERDFGDKNEVVQFYFLEEFGVSAREIERAKTHKVKGAGRVVCAKKVVVERDRETKLPTGKFWVWDGRTDKGLTNKEPQHNCRFCDEKKEFKNKLLAKVGLAPGAQIADKADSVLDRDYHKNANEIYFPVAYKILTRDKGKLVEKTKEFKQGWLSLRVGDALSDTGKGYWKQLLDSHKEGKYMGRWWSLKMDGILTREDKLDELAEEMTLNRAELAPMHKPYVEGLKLYTEKENKARDGVELLGELEAIAEVKPQVGSAKPTQSKASEVDDDDIPF